MNLRSKLIRLAHEKPALRAQLLPLLKEAAPGQYMEVKTLPAVLQKVLKEVGYGKRDIRVEGRDKYNASGLSGDGMRRFVAVVDLVSGQHKIQYGSWGGANMFSPGNQVDMDSKSYPIPHNGAVVEGHEGGGHPVSASIATHPDNLQKLLPAGSGAEGPTPDEVLALQIMKMYKPGYRKEYFQRHKELGVYAANNPLIQSLVSKGLVKATGAGIMLTTAGRNVVESAPRRYDI